jgi:hypothetical protein
MLPFKRLAIQFLAKQEAQQALNADEKVLQAMDYYDICIKAVKK